MKFRDIPNTLCFCEPFNGQLASISGDYLEILGPASWNSGHPAGEPYFKEYQPLLLTTGGIRLFEPAMEMEWHMPDGGLQGNLRLAERRYIRSLLQYARDKDRVPVFGFCASLGRIAPLKQQFGGTHIFLRRNLWSQWLSYLAQKEAGNSWFCDKIFDTICTNDDDYLNDVHNYYLKRSIGRSASSAHGLAGPQTPPAGASRRLFDGLHDGDLFAMFMAVHLYLYIHAEMTADMTVDSTRLALDPAYCGNICQQITKRTRIRVSLADARHGQQFAMMDPATIDWDAIEVHRRAAIRALSAVHGTERPEAIAARLLDEARAEMTQSERYLQTARARVNSLIAKQAQITEDRE
jgi:hypothetical protein